MMNKNGTRQEIQIIHSDSKIPKVTHVTNNENGFCEDEIQYYVPNLIVRIDCDGESFVAEAPYPEGVFCPDTILFPESNNFLEVM